MHALLPTKYITDLVWRSLFARKGQEHSLQRFTKKLTKQVETRQKTVLQDTNVNDWFTALLWMKYICNYDNLFCLVQFKSLQTNWADEIFTFKTCASTQSNENSLTRYSHKCKTFSKHACSCATNRTYPCINKIYHRPCLEMIVRAHSEQNCSESDLAEYLCAKVSRFGDSLWFSGSLARAS